jgi:glycosyltransferase involved in cell wall biosynthesis
MEQRPALSAVVITLNVADTLPDCLVSLSFADEIVVVDAGSTDGTTEIAQRLGARVLEHQWLGFGPQKQFAVEQARHDWVLCVDSDERVAPELAQAITECLAAPEFKAYEVPRSNYFLGRYLKHGEGYPDWSLRLFDRRYARWSDALVHEKVLCEGKVARIQRSGALMHHSADSLASYLDKQNRYTTLQAEALWASGERAGLGRLIVSPLLRFIKFYFLRRGFLDGTPGLVHVIFGCFNSFAKYAKLRALEQSRP